MFAAEQALKVVTRRFEMVILGQKDIYHETGCLVDTILFGTSTQAAQDYFLCLSAPSPGQAQAKPEEKVKLTPRSHVFSYMSVHL